MPEVSSTSLAEILGAEIMRVGTWNGNKFTSKDLEDIATAAPDVGYVPPLKVGHDESIGARAWGWVQNIRLAGEKLVADLMDIPESLAATIKERGYDQLSAEIYLDLDRDGKKFRRALKAVALLGAEVPAVSGLKPLRELFHGVQAAEIWYADHRPTRRELINQSEGGRTMPEKHQDEHIKPDPEVARLREEAVAMKAKADAQAAQLAEQKAAAEAQAAELKSLKERSEAQAAELKTQKEQTAALEAKNREIALTAKLDAWKGPPSLRPDMECLWRAAAEFPRTVRFAVDPAKPEDIPFETAVDNLANKLATQVSWMLKPMAVVGGTDYFDDPGAEVDARTKKMMSENPTMDYRVASKRVLDSDEALKQAYAGG